MIPDGGVCGITVVVAGASVGVLAEQRIDAAVPLAVEEFELAFGRCLVGFDDLDQRFQMDAFVGAVAVRHEHMGIRRLILTGTLPLFTKRNGTLVMAQS